MVMYSEFAAVLSQDLGPVFSLPGVMCHRTWCSLSTPAAGRGAQDLDQGGCADHHGLLQQQMYGGGTPCDCRLQRVEEV